MSEVANQHLNTLEEEYLILTERVVITQFWFEFTMVILEK